MTTPSINGVTGSVAAKRSTEQVTVKVFIDDIHDVTLQPGGLMSLSVYKEFNKIPTALCCLKTMSQKTENFKKAMRTSLFRAKK